jgi:octaprenyl-diphosphate synthase
MPDNVCELGFFMQLESIRSVVQNDLAAIDVFLAEELQSSVPLINEMIQYIVSSGGKRIRPLLVLLGAKACHYEQNQHIQLAAAIELIHTATLLHDDVVDESSLRRGRQTAHFLWGNPASILVGDFLYSRAFQIIVRQQNLKVMNIFADATNIIAEGEMLQLLNCNDPNTSETAYYDVITRKTGKLFEVSAQLGPAISHASEHDLLAMQAFGMNLGIAYQLIDDALDYSTTEKIGKNCGNDLAEGKPTLPLIYAIQKGSKIEAAFIRQAIENGSIDNLDRILHILQSTDAVKMAKQHAEKAITALNLLPPTPYRQALTDLTTFVVDRHF